MQRISSPKYTLPSLKRFPIYGLLICITIAAGLVVSRLNASSQLALLISLSAGVIGGGIFRAIASRRSLSFAQFVLLTVIVTIPVIKWSGPGNTALPDAFLLVAIIYALAAIVNAKAFLIPRRTLFLAYLGILGGGILATALSPLPSRSFLTLSQELYLCLVWIAIYNLAKGGRDDALRTWSAQVWTVVAIVTAVLVIIGATNVLPTISRELVFLQSRGTGLFRDPNMAAHYLALSLFIIPFAFHRAKRPRLFLVQASAVSIVLVGIVLTKSNGIRVALAAAMLAVILGKLLIITHRGQLLALMIAIMFIIFGVVTATIVSDQLLRLIDEINDASIGSALRISSFNYTLENRMASWRRAYEAFRLSPWGVGPGVLGKYDRDELLGYNEAHNDFLSVLAERGWLGFLALLVFSLNLLVVPIQDLVRSKQSPDTSQQILALSRLGMAMCVFVMGLSVDTLHFRHLWVAIPLFLAYRNTTNERA